MAGTRAFRLLDIPIVLGIIVGSAYLVYVTVIYLGPLVLYPTYVDYAPAELVLNRFDPYGGWRHDFALSPTRKQLVAAGAGKIYWIDDWDDEDLLQTEIQELHVAEVYAATYSGDGKRVAFFIVKHGNPPVLSIAFYDSGTRQLLGQWPAPPEQWFSRLFISHDGSALLNWSDGGLQVMKSSNGELISTIKTPTDRAWVSFAGHGRLVMVGCDDHYEEFALYVSEEPYKDMQLVSSVKAPTGTQLTRPLLSPDGSYVALRVHPTYSVNVYRIADGQEIAKLEGTCHVVSFAFSSSGRFLAISYSDDTVTLWRIDSATKLCTLRGLPFYPIRFLAFGSDEKTLLTRDVKATVVWDIRRYAN